MKERAKKLQDMIIPMYVVLKLQDWSYLRASILLCHPARVITLYGNVSASGMCIDNQIVWASVPSPSTVSHGHVRSIFEARKLWCATLCTYRELVWEHPITPQGFAGEHPGGGPREEIIPFKALATDEKSRWRSEALVYLAWLSSKMFISKK